MTKYIGAGRSEYMVKSKISQLPGGSRVGIITFRLKDKQPASWLYAYLEEKDRFVWFTFMSYKATPMNWNVSECWDIIRSYEYYGKPIYDQAIKDYNRSKDTEPRNAEIYFDRGNNNAKIGQYDQAISDYDKAIEINPRYAKAYNNRGIAHAIKGQYKKTISDYNKAIEINSRFAEAYNNRAVAYFYKRDYETAWDDVYKAQSLGYKVHPGFLNALRQASGKEK
jgi:tetratricopeptide (TPR) repeat protein